MEPNSYKIVFVKLSESDRDLQKAEASVSEAKQIETELDEIAELKRFILEIAEPDPKSYTVT